MTTNARALHDPSQDQTGFSKLPTPAEMAAMRSSPNQAPAGTKETLILGKFKSQEELAQSYKELEQRLGQQGQEVGQLRALTDKLLDLKKAETGGPSGRTAPAPVTSDELLRDPQAAISRVVKDSTADLEARLADEHRARVRAEFGKAHPTFEQDMQDPDFQNFIKTSPYRATLAQKTIAGDIQAAHELWTGWEETRGKAKPASGKSREEQDREQALRDASGMVSGGGSTGTADGDGSNAGKPVYSRQDLIMMRIKDPNRYYDPAFQELITQAYKDKRVR